MMNLKEKPNGMNHALKTVRAEQSVRQCQAMTSNAAIAEEGNAKGQYVDRQGCS
jgi:hypothetical protein